MDERRLTLVVNRPRPSLKVTFWLMVNVQGRVYVGKWVAKCSSFSRRHGGGDFASAAVQTAFAGVSRPFLDANFPQSHSRGDYLLNQRMA